MGLVPRVAWPVGAATGRPCSGSSGRVAREPDSSPSLPSQGSPGASFQPAHLCSPTASPTSAARRTLPQRGAPGEGERVGGSSGHTSALSRVPSSWRSFSPSVQDFRGLSPPSPTRGDRQTLEQMDRLAGWGGNSGSDGFYFGPATATSQARLWRNAALPVLSQMRCSNLSEVPHWVLFPSFSGSRQTHLPKNKNFKAFPARKKGNTWRFSPTPPRLGRSQP